jgi:hypothetical protein
MKIMLQDFNAEVGKEYTLSLQLESLHEISCSNDNRVRAVNFPTFKRQIAKSKIVPSLHYRIYLGRYLMSDLSDELTVISGTIWCLSVSQ